MTDPTRLDDQALAAHMTSLDDEQLSTLLDQLDAAEILAAKRTVNMSASALWYAQRLHWPVFPLQPRGKKPLTTRGFHDATHDPQQITAWWQQWPDANIGIPTGPVEDGGCGYDVLDIDGPAGMQAWATLKHAHCPPGCSDRDFCPAAGPFDIQARAYTPGGPGRHMYVPATGKGNTARIGGQPLDWRGLGGYVVAPPSVGLSGVRYTWLTWPATPAAGEAAA